VALNDVATKWLGGHVDRIRSLAANAPATCCPEASAAGRGARQRDGRRQRGRTARSRA